jgi:hypothetical protein
MTVMGGDAFAGLIHRIDAVARLRLLQQAQISAAGTFANQIEQLRNQYDGSLDRTVADLDREDLVAMLRSWSYWWPARWAHVIGIHAAPREDLALGVKRLFIQNWEPDEPEQRDVRGTGLELCWYDASQPHATEFDDDDGPSDPVAEGAFLESAIYTIIDPERLEGHARTGVTFEEGRPWVAGARFFEKARIDGRMLALVLADSLATDRLVGWTYVRGLNITSKTVCATGPIVRLRRGRHDSIRKHSDGRPLALNYIRPYMPCQLPSFVPRTLDRLRALEGIGEGAAQPTPITPAVEFPALVEGLPREESGVDPTKSRTCGLGTVYRRAEVALRASDQIPFDVDPEKVERGNKGHADTQNALADFLRSEGIEPRSAAPGEPEFDVAWVCNGKTFVAEVKSITDQNEEKQLRLGLGQVLRYRQVLAAGRPDVIGVLVAERRPADPTWESLCSALGVRLVWPAGFPELDVRTMLRDPQSDFATIYSELRQLEHAFNPEHKDLHFSAVEGANGDLFLRLLALAKAGLEKVREHRAYFLERGLYADGMFWYDLCLLISAASGSLQKDRLQQTIPRNAVEALLLAVVDVAEFSLRTKGDMVKRTYEALGNMLMCFRDWNVSELARARAVATGLDEVEQFVNGTIERVKELIAKP